MKQSVLLILLINLTTGCQSQNKEADQYQLIGPCEGCEAVFEYGSQQLDPIDTLAEFEKHSPKLKLTGTIYKPDGKTPASDVILYAYQTNKEGKYPTKGGEEGWAKRHGYIRGWIKTDSSGKYTFYTFMPGSYDNNEAHIHATILEPNGRYYWIDEYIFMGDPNLKKKLNSAGQGGSGLVKLKQQGDLLIAERDIILGFNVSGYE